MCFKEVKTIRRTDLVYYRVAATVSIFLCHIFAKSSIPLLQMSTQFFNVGVSMFFVLSGYLYGMNRIKSTVRKWYYKRCIRICVPEYIFALVLLLIHLALSYRIIPLNWAFLALNLQGFEIYVNGAEHLWYLTVILFCYLVTPLLDKLFKPEKPSVAAVVCVLLFVSAFSVVCAYFIHRHTAIYIVYILLYIIAFLLGRYCKSFVAERNVFLCVAFAFGFAMIRLAGKIFADGSTLYDVFIVGITQGGIALSLLFAVCSIKKLKAFKALLWFDKISYEFYLVHYMFLIGPLYLFNLTSVNVVNWLIIAVVSLCLAWILHLVDNKVILFLVGKNKQNSDATPA